MFNLILLDWCKMTNIFVVLMRCQCYFLIVMIQLQLKVCVQIFLNKVIFYIFDLIWPCLGMVGECWYTRGFHSCSGTKSQKSYLAVFICSQHLTKIQTFIDAWIKAALGSARMVPRQKVAYVILLFYPINLLVQNSQQLFNVFVQSKIKPLFDRKLSDFKVGS